jgi:hypothetical protein
VIPSIAPGRSPQWRAPFAAAFALALVVSTAAAQQHGKQPKAPSAPALSLTPLVGLPIPVLPATFLVADTGIVGIPVGRVAQLAWADSVLLDALQTRGPEANWMGPAELRRAAKRAPGMMPDPDHMSQSALRFESIKRVPDPILANLRMMIAMTNTRYVMVPASVRFRRMADGVEATTVLVLADPRSGEILWRSTPVAAAATAGAALAGTIAWVLPDTR